MWKLLNKLFKKYMDELEPETLEQTSNEVAPEATKSVCENCNDSGRECYVCGAGKQVE